jgi:alkaline phosphatase D
MDFDALDGGIDLESIDEGRGLGRRSFLMGALAVGAAASTPFNYAAAARKRRVPFAKDGKFDLGVASGFPRPKGITLWTHLHGPKKTAKVNLMVATDKKFKNVVEEKLVTARDDRGMTAKTFVKGLKPSEEYYYRFFTDNSKSMLGRFRTAPPLNSKQKIRIAFYSCQHYEAGFYNVQRAIANEKDIDLVICLGDYMYEYSDKEGPSAARRVREDHTGNNRDGDVQLLNEYRQKYHLYKSDPDLKAMHAAHPFLSIWDDHEVEDNHADGNPSSAQDDPNKTNLKDYPRKVPYAVRKANGYKAFFNYMPRMRFKGDRDRIYEDYRLGSLVDLIATDERQYRDQQPCNDVQLSPCNDTENPNRTFLGAKQKDWFLRTVKNSPALWKVWATQLMVMSLRLSPGVAAQVDAWDGYGAERKAILEDFNANGVKNLVAVTGDIHTFFAGTAYTTGDESTGQPALAEFVGGSATSSGIKEATGITDAQVAVLAASNPHLDYYDIDNKGYGVIELSANEAICEFKAVAHKVRNQPTPQTIARFRLGLGQKIVQRIG